MVITIDTNNKTIIVSGEIDIDALRSIQKDYPDYVIGTAAPETVVYKDTVSRDAPYYPVWCGSASTSAG